MKTCIICNKIDCNLGWHEIQSEIQTRRKKKRKDFETRDLVLSSGLPCPSFSIFNPYDLPQHWLSDYPKPHKYHEGTDRGATDEGY